MEDRKRTGSAPAGHRPGGNDAHWCAPFLPGPELTKWRDQDVAIGERMGLRIGIQGPKLGGCATAGATEEATEASMS